MINFIRDAMNRRRADKALEKALSDPFEITVNARKSISHDPQISDEAFVQVEQKISAALAMGANPNLSFGDTDFLVLPLNQVLKFPAVARQRCLQVLLVAGADPFLEKPTFFAHHTRRPFLEAYQKYPESFAQMLQAPVSASKHALKCLESLPLRFVGEELPVSSLQALQDHFEAHVLRLSPGRPVNYLWADLYTNEKSFLDYAAYMPVLSHLKWLLNQPSFDVQKMLQRRDADGCCLLLRAIKWSDRKGPVSQAHCEVVRALVGAGADIGVVNRQGRGVMDVLPEAACVDGNPLHDLLKALSSSNDAKLAIDRMMDLSSSQAPGVQP